MDVSRVCQGVASRLLKERWNSVGLFNGITAADGIVVENARAAADQLFQENVTYTKLGVDGTRKLISLPFYSAVQNAKGDCLCALAEVCDLEFVRLNKADFSARATSAFLTDEVQDRCDDISHWADEFETQAEFMYCFALIKEMQLEIPAWSYALGSWMEKAYSSGYFPVGFVGILPEGSLVGYPPLAMKDDPS